MQIEPIDNVMKLVKSAGDGLGVNCEWYGELHLIESLRDLKSVYDEPRFESASAFADYARFSDHHERRRACFAGRAGRDGKRRPPSPANGLRCCAGT